MLLQMTFIFNCIFLLPSLQILGNAGLSLQQEFYTIERLSEEIGSSVFVSLDHVPDHRLRPMIHILFHACMFKVLSLGSVLNEQVSLTSVTVVFEAAGALVSTGVL